MANNMFVTAYNFLNNNTGTIGICRFAYNTGSSPGVGMGYDGDADQAGDNAWAMFGFMSASVPFYLLIQYTQTQSLGNTGSAGSQGGFPALNLLNSGKAYGYAFQIAQRSDGGNPWNGTTASNGNDVKGNPVWISGSASIVGVHPPVNTRICGVTTASIYTSSHYMRSFFDVASSSCRLHLMADEENIIMLARPGSTGSSSTYHIHYFGKLQTMTQSFARPRWEVPYVYFSTYNTFGDPSIKYWAGNPNPLRTFGDLFGGDGNGTNDGGALYHSASLGMGRLLFDIPVRHRLWWFNLNYNFIPPRRDAIPLNVWFSNNAYFTGTGYGISFAGTTSRFLRLIGDVSEHDVDNNYEFATVGRAGTGFYFYNQTRFVRQSIAIPWGGAIIPGTSTSRTGVQF